ncbi:WS/DGAT/MGAT family O-acyltransferase [Pseudonocardia sp. GCM10023141]|uniref:WS/DGAT/MGAT family O-acyltransferase n=1 Tax=Pseudonocardia sp. GCM10023141 TaxID=3252653 RepID=UPI00360ED416
MDRMTPLDAAFLQIEDSEPTASLAISSVAVFDGPPPTPEDFRRHIAGRLPLIPRYRQKVRQIPLDIGPPVWIDDEHFDIDYHLRRTALPDPGGDAELAALLGRVMSARLDRDHPLWEYWLVEGLAGGRWALISKVHHCMVDGVSGTDLYRVILDPTPTPPPVLVDEWHPAPEPSGLRLTADAALELARNPIGQARAIADVVRHPTTLAGMVRDTLRGAATLATAAWPAPASSISGPLSANRRFAFGRGTVVDVATIRKSFGGTFNDVVLSAITGGYRALLLGRHETPAPGLVRTLVPVSVRAPGEEGTRGNRVSLMLATLPIEVADPVERLAAVTSRLAALKADHEAEAGAALIGIAGIEPFPLSAATVRTLSLVPQRAVVTVTTNVAGPREPLYAAGRQLREIIPYVPIGSTMRIGVAIFSYCGAITFGVTGDYDSASDIGVLARGIEGGMAELAAAAKAAGQPASNGTARKHRAGKA